MIFLRFQDTFSNLVAVLRPNWKCLQQLNDTDKSVALNEHLRRWDEKYRRDMKYFEPDQLLTKSEQEKIKFYKITPLEQKALLEKEIDDAIKSTDLSVPERRLFDAQQEQFKPDSKIKRIRKISESENLLDVMIDHDDARIGPILEAIESVASKKVCFLAQ